MAWRVAEDLVENELAVDPNRLAYLSKPLQRPVRMSGTPQVSVRADLTASAPTSLRRDAIRPEYP